MSKPTAISFEYFPAKTDAGREKLLNVTTPELQAIGPELFSVTFGAGGSTRDNTRGIVEGLNAQGCSVPPRVRLGFDEEATMASLLES